jgi:signal recognition particle GTPase
MNGNTTKIHLKVGEIEISIEGNPDFVSKQYREMEKELKLGKKISSGLPEGTEEKEESPAPKKSVKPAQKRKPASKETTKDDFGAWLQKLPKGLKDRDKALVAAYYNQLLSGNNLFRVRDMNNTLKKHEIKITNPSSLIKNVAKSKQIIEQVSREGRQVYYQFTKEGEGYIKDLLSARTA